MKKFLLSLLSVCLIQALTSCSPTSSNQSAETSSPSVTTSGEIILPEEAIAAAQQIIMDEYAPDANFVQDECEAYDTNVPGRYRVEGRFSTKEKDYSALVFSIYIQKFTSGWDYGNFKINNAWDGKSVLWKNGNMKKKEQTEGVGNTITAGGVDFTVAELSPQAIRIYTDSKLSRDQLKAAILDLMDTYDTIQFGTADKHERGDEYASWTGNLFFDFDSDEIINKAKFLN